MEGLNKISICHLNNSKGIITETDIKGNKGTNKKGIYEKLIIGLDMIPMMQIMIISEIVINPP